MTTRQPLAEYLESARKATRRGAAVLESWRHRFAVREKGRSDLVTDADLGSQKAIREYLNERHPGHDFLGEEEVPTGARPDGRPLWIVDPLDGTTNYVHDVPLYCVSVGLQLDGELVVGAVLDPSRQELFSAARGMGAWLGERPLRTSPVRRLEEALLATGFPSDLRGREQVFHWWRKLSLHAQSLRRTGSTALSLAYVAAGRFDGFWAFDNHVWDVAGATVLVREAGGVVTNVDGRPFDPYAPDALASNGPLHPLLLEQFPKGGAEPRGREGAS
jgi:myo-inositol-1(or 4)-monophosphatase